MGYDEFNCRANGRDSGTTTSNDTSGSSATPAKPHGHEGAKKKERMGLADFSPLLTNLVGKLVAVERRRSGSGGRASVVAGLALWRR